MKTIVAESSGDRAQTSTLPSLWLVLQSGWRQFPPVTVGAVVRRSDHVGHLLLREAQPCTTSLIRTERRLMARAAGDRQLATALWNTLWLRIAAAVSEPSGIRAHGGSQRGVLHPICAGNQRQHAR